MYTHCVDGTMMAIYLNQLSFHIYCSSVREGMSIYMCMLNAKINLCSVLLNKVVIYVLP